MAIDNRDWYRDWWRKKTGYTEKANFRISEKERADATHRAAWRKNLLTVGIGLTSTIALFALLRFLRN